MTFKPRLKIVKKNCDQDPNEDVSFQERYAFASTATSTSRNNTKHLKAKEVLQMAILFWALPEIRETFPVETDICLHLQALLFLNGDFLDD